MEFRDSRRSKLWKIREPTKSCNTRATQKSRDSRTHVSVEIAHITRLLGKSNLSQSLRVLSAHERFFSVAIHSFFFSASCIPSETIGSLEAYIHTRTTSITIQARRERERELIPASRRCDCANQKVRVYNRLTKTDQAYIYDTLLDSRLLRAQVYILQRMRLKGLHIALCDAQ